MSNRNRLVPVSPWSAIYIDTTELANKAALTQSQYFNICQALNPQNEVGPRFKVLMLWQHFGIPARGWNKVKNYD
jgi:hypothetical protein